MLQDYERMNLADALMSKKFKDGDCVINQVNVVDYKHLRKSWKQLLNKVCVINGRVMQFENSKKCKFLA